MKQPPLVEQDGSGEYAVLTWQGGYSAVTKHWFAEPMDALTAAVEYLRKGYSCRLHEGTASALAAQGTQWAAGNGAARSTGRV